MSDPQSVEIDSVDVIFSHPIAPAEVDVTLNHPITKIWDCQTIMLTIITCILLLIGIITTILYVVGVNRLNRLEAKQCWIGSSIGISYDGGNWYHYQYGGTFDKSWFTDHNSPRFSNKIYMRKQDFTALFDRYSSFLPAGRSCLLDRNDKHEDNEHGTMYLDYMEDELRDKIDSLLLAEYVVGSLLLFFSCVLASFIFIRTRVRRYHTLVNS